jgi:glycosyltransferase involved in cell wall biosynthesis
MKTIALVDWFWEGHHPNYFVHYAIALAQAGYTVAPLCARPPFFERILESKKLPEDIRKRIFPAVYTHRQRPSPNWIPQSWRSAYGYGTFYLFLRKQLRKWQRDNSQSIDLVFFACIYDGDFQHFHLVERFFGFRWSGLYLHARKFRIPNSEIPYWGLMPCPERIFDNRLLHSIAVLDERAVVPLQRISGRSVHIFPDLAVESLPAGGLQRGFAKKLKSFAQGRPIVSLTGHLQWTKGFGSFTHAAKQPGLEGAFFFLGGDLSWSQVSYEDQSSLRQAWEETENLYTHPQHLPEETMNAIIAMSSIVVAAYISFPNSSNVLTKAALFKRPIIVSDGFLMAERVRHYNLGEVVPENNPQALASAIERMLHPNYYRELSARAKWQEYRAAHSFEALVSAMSKAVAG